MRQLRGLRRVRGWKRFANAVIGGSAEPFQISNNGILVTGTLASFIEREIYLFGGYEQDLIDLFIAQVPLDRRHTILDVGANIGTHSLRFSQAFDAVHAFECNPTIYPLLQANLALNKSAPITAHPIGLGDTPGEFDLFAPVGINGGLGTFLQTDQYSQPIVKMATARIETADSLVPSQITGPIDAIKCDVQGFELAVLRGARELIAAHRPIIWVELSDALASDQASMREFMELLPKPARFLRFVSESRFGSWSVTLVETDPANISGGDHIIVPGAS